MEIKTGETDKTVNVTNTKIYGTVTLTKYDGKEGASVLKGLKGVKPRLTNRRSQQRNTFLRGCPARDKQRK